MGILSGVNNFFFDVVKFFNKPGPTRTFDIALTRSRVKPNVKTAELLGVTDVTMHESSVLFALTGLANNVLTETLDTTTYSDKAILRLYNGTGNDRYLTTLQLDGKRIMRYSGSGGGLVFDGLKKDDDIRRNGLQEMEISNNYLVTAVQVEKVGDYWWKAAGKKKHLFALTIPGVAWWYSPGDWYNFAVGTAGTAEYIDAVVECYSVDVEKTSGSIGSTNIMFREVEENWAKTTLYTARLLASGSPKRRVNRSNTVTVASSTYDGTYDYRCDGVDDDVQIQAAIDYVYQTYGGGEIVLTDGIFKVTTGISIPSNIIIRGKGQGSTILERDGDIYCIYVLGTSLVKISNIGIFGIKIKDKTGNLSAKELYRIEYAVKFYIKECVGNDCYGPGIYILNSDIGTIDGFIATGCSNDGGLSSQGAMVFYSDTAVSIVNCNTTHNKYNGLFINTCTGVIVSNCNISHNSHNGVDVIFGGKINIESNVMSSNVEYGIFLGNAGSTESSIISNNQINSNGAGIYVTGDSIIINNNDASLNTGSGISVIIGNRVNVNNNTVFGNGTNGIYLANDINDSLISANNVYNNGSTGIFVGPATADRNVVTGNRSTGNTTANFTNTGTNTTITGNDWT
jgi:hypothetical protein